MQRLTIIHNVSCVYSKYAMIDKKEFDKINGFSSQYNDISESIELCLKMLNNKKQIVINPIVSIKVEKLLNAQKPNKIKEEEFIKKWEENYKQKDIFYSPNLSYEDTGLAYFIK